MNELEQFLGNLDNNQEDLDILNAPLNPEPEKEKEEEKEEEEEEQEPEEVEDDDEEEEAGLKPKNRRERRLMQKLEQEREASIFLAGKLEARSEAEKFLSDEEADYLKGIERIYGTDSPEAEMATNLLKKAITGARDDAETRAYQRFVESQQSEQMAVQEAESELDNILEDIQDDYNVELSPSQQRQYFELLQQMSPKDRSGEVTSLADPYAVFDLFQEKLNKPRTDNRAKKLSSRSMTQSGTGKDTDFNEDVMARELREMGII